MVKVSLSLLLLSIFCLAGLVAPAFARHSRSRAYIEASCQTTRYPSLCVRYLSSFANSSVENPQKLAQLALSVSLYRARYTRAYLLKLEKQLKVVQSKEYPAVRDCLAQISDSVAQLTQSIRELRRMGRLGVDGDFSWHINNVETWAGSALTDASTCIDEFPGKRMSKLRATIKGKVLNMAQVTSNALALFHHFAATKKP